MFKFISKLLRLLGLQCVIELKQESKVQLISSLINTFYYHWRLSLLALFEVCDN